MTQDAIAPPLEPGDQGFNSPDPEIAAIEQEAPYEDYFGYEKTDQWFFPDGRQYISFQRMNEGARASFQKKTTKDITIVRGTQDAKMKVDPATERWELLSSSVKGWHLVKRHPRTGEFTPVPFSIGSPGAEFEKWMSTADPDLIDSLEKAIRKANPWLRTDETLEDIDKEMDNLRERREEILARERGEGSSGSK